MTEPKQVWRVRMGRTLTHPKTGETVAFAGQEVQLDHPAVVGNPMLDVDCYLVDVPEPAPKEEPPAPRATTRFTRPQSDAGGDST